MDLEKFISNLHLILYPNTLWGAHIDPSYEFIVFLHVNMKSVFNVNVDKAVIVYKCNDAKVKLSTLINNQRVSISTIQENVTTYADITHAISVLNEVKLCSNYANSDFPRCNKYVNFGDKNSLCMECSPLIVNELENFIMNQNTEYQNVLDSKGKVRCTLCSSNFNCNFHLKDHERIFNGMRSSICDICNKINSHVANHPKPMPSHSKHNQFVCSICSKSYSNKFRMDEHFLTHNKVKNFECNICFKKFTTKSNLKVHVRNHIEKKPYGCNICGKSYTTPSNLLTHKKSIHMDTKPHMCVICKMSFVHPRLLRIHMRKHTGEKPYSCIMCTKTFTKNIHLTVHMRTHTGERPYNCNVCDKTFSTTGNLNSHRKVHDNLS